MLKEQNDTKGEGHTELPRNSTLKSAKGAGESNWNLTGHVIFTTAEGDEGEYFLKVSLFSCSRSFLLVLSAAVIGRLLFSSFG